MLISFGVALNGDHPYGYRNGKNSMSKKTVGKKMLFYLS
jgi:hypothetical protein